MKSTRYDGDNAWGRWRGEGNPQWDDEKRGVTAQAAAATVVAATAEVVGDTGDYFSSLAAGEQIPFSD